MQLVSAMNQGNQAFVTLENEVSSFEQAARQEIAQLLTYVEYQVDLLFHIDTNTSNSTPNTVVPQTGNNSDSGNVSSSPKRGSTADQNNGSSLTGSGSNSQTKPHAAADTQVQPLDSSDDTDGSGTITGGISGTAPGSVFLNNGVISGDPGGPGATFNGGCLYVYEGKDGSFGGQFLGSGTLGDGTTFSVTGDDNSFTATVSGNTVTGTYQASGTNSEDDDVDIDGTFQGTVDGNGNVTGGTFTCSINVAEPPPNNDTLVWKPKNGNNASTEANWYDQTQGKQGVEIPSADNTVIFDGSVSNAPITWDQDFTFSEMELGPAVGGAAYTGKQTINSNVKVELTGAGGTSLSTNITGSNLYLYFNDGAIFQVDANATITNMNLAGSGVYFKIDGGTTTIAQSSGYSETIGVPVIIASGATLNDQSYTSLKFTNSSISIRVAGNMNLFYSGITLIDNNGYSNDYINVDGGTLGYYGSPTVTDKLTVPVWVRNGGTFTLSVAKDQVLCGTLVVVDGSGYVFPTGTKESVYMTDPTSTVQLSKNAVLECDDNYVQADGTLSTTDNSTCTLTDGATGQGPATIAGGTLWIDKYANEYGTLKVNGNLTLDGNLSVSVLGYAPNGNAGTSDILNVAGTLTLVQTESTLFVNDYGQLQKMGNMTDFWAVIQSNNNIVGDFKSGGETSSPQANLTYGPPNDPVPKQYQITFNG